MSEQMERDSHFEGFASLLIPEIDEVIGAVTDWAIEHDASKQQIAQELLSRWRLLIARRAYDLAFHTLYHNGYEAWFKPGPNYTPGPKYERNVAEHIEEIPDITKWPKQSE